MASAGKIQGTPNTIAQVVEILRRGGVGIIPTETVYGLAANARDPKAVARIFEIKKRPHFNPLIVHVASLEAARKLVGHFPEAARLLAKRFWPGPLTLVLPKSPAIPDIVTAGLPFVAIRVPAHPITQEILEQGDLAVAAPSANPYQTLSPTEISHLTPSLVDQVDFLLDGGPCSIGVESTVVSFAGPQPVILRPGGLEPELVQSVIGPLPFSIKDSQKPLAPGMTGRHYAPRTPVVFPWDAATKLPSGRLGFLGLYPPPSPHLFSSVAVLSRNGDLHEAASRLFDSLRSLDSLALDAIIALPFPHQGLGIAINDRLRRAAQELAPL